MYRDSELRSKSSLVDRPLFNLHGGGEGGRVPVAAHASAPLDVRLGGGRAAEVARAATIVFAIRRRPPKTKE